ncbi:UDP-N-acetylmuramoyl-tripeptide--D-alanyl-D-alanine ligase [Gemmatimonadetes bacterium T265]|nr:UDP-N-acetylmuramoyl-tripeptide--D-alanyl-D-alanine ligase [Gemmatimonadetes bacterium T265]
MSGGIAPAVPVPFWTLDRAGEALAAVLGAAAPRGPEALLAVSTDTRAVVPGDLFVALAGERYDAHDFLGDAVARGARALVVHDAARAADVAVPAYVVRDTREALGLLARYRRRAWAAPGRAVVGVAGSNGKTSTKELLRAALGAARAVHATAGNFNNLVGVPLTLLALPDGADVAVVEMGTNAPGEIAALRSIVEPDVVVMTSIGEEHLEGLGDLAGVLREESEAFDGAALAVVPADQPEIAAAAGGRAGAVVTAGLDAGDVHAERWALSGDGTGVVVVGGVEVRTPLRGAHNLRNTMLAVAVARALGVSLADAARGLAAMPVPSMRTAWTTLGDATLINDAYNANPPSARAALDLLAAAGRAGGAASARQRVAVLGTMRELGPDAPALHDAVARHALALGIELVAGVGEFAAALARVAPGDARVVTAEDPAALWPRLEPRLAADGVILLKGSRGVRLEQLLPFLEAWATAGATRA